MIHRYFRLLRIAVFLAFAVILNTLHAQRFDWAGQGTTSNQSQATAVAVGAQGQVVTVGQFIADLDLDPGPGTYLLTGSPSQYTTFIQVLTASGTFVWGGAIQGTTGGNVPRSVEVDPLGNIVIAGDLAGDADLDPGPGVDSGLVDIQGIYLLRLSAGGTYLGGIAIDGPYMQYENGSVLALDGDNGIYVVADFIGSVEVGTGVVLQDAGNGDMFIARFDSSLNYVWHAHLGSTSQELGFCIATDANSVMVAARLTNQVDVDPSPATVMVGSTGNVHGLVARYSHAGTYEWASLFTNTTFGDIMLMGMTVTPSQDILVTGQFGGTVDMDPGPGTSLITTAGGDDVLVARLSSTGGLEWARRMGGIDADMGRNIATDTAGNAYVDVIHYSAMDLDPGPGTYLATQPAPQGSLDAAMVKLDSMGDFVWAGLLMGNGLEILLDLKVAAHGEIYGVGGFSTSFDVDPSPTGTYTLTATTNLESFIFAWGQDSCTDMRVHVDSVQGLDCAATNGSAFTHATGGMPPYSYVWAIVPSDLDSVGTVSAPGLYSVTATDSRGCEDEVQVAIPGPSAGGYDLQVNLVADVFRPGGITDITLDAFNAGCTPITGQVKLKLSPLTTFVSANPAATLIAPDTLSWAFSGMNYDSGHLIIQVSLLTATTATIGDTVRLPVVITPVLGDDAPLDNVRADYAFPVMNSLDPNRIDAYPPGMCAEHYVQSGTPITYTVQFQNTGTAEAREVEVLDTLPLGFDPASFTLLASSHPVVASIRDGNVVVLTYNDIHLADSTSDEPASHGHAVFRVMPQPGLASGTVLSTHAAIYFDYNPPVITNHAQVTMVDVVPACAVAVAPAVPEHRLQLYPNPTSEAFWVAGLQQDTYVRVLDMYGRVVWTGHAHAGEPLKVSVLSWARGMYWLEAGATGQRLLVR